MKKSEIIEVLNYNIESIILIENKEKKTGIYNCTLNLDACYCVLNHLRDYLLNYGYKKFINYMSEFDCVKFYRNQSVYNFLTYIQEFRLQDAINRLYLIIKK